MGTLDDEFEYSDQIPDYDTTDPSHIRAVGDRLQQLVRHLNLMGRQVQKLRGGIDLIQEGGKRRDDAIADTREDLAELKASIKKIDTEVAEVVTATNKMLSGDETKEVQDLLKRRAENKRLRAGLAKWLGGALGTMVAVYTMRDWIAVAIKWFFR